VGVSVCCLWVHRLAVALLCETRVPDGVSSLVGRSRSTKRNGLIGGSCAPARGQGLAATPSRFTSMSFGMFEGSIVLLLQLEESFLHRHPSHPSRLSLYLPSLRRTIIGLLLLLLFPPFILFPKLLVLLVRHRRTEKMSPYFDNFSSRQQRLGGCEAK
jgi:hypothetical protein